MVASMGMFFEDELTTMDVRSSKISMAHGEVSVRFKELITSTDHVCGNPASKPCGDDTFHT